jgi:hypothetical protein
MSILANHFYLLQKNKELVCPVFDKNTPVFDKNTGILLVTSKRKTQKIRSRKIEMQFCEKPLKDYI